MAIDTIVEPELQRALSVPDPLRGVAALVARRSAAFVLDPDGVTRTTVPGSERMSHKLHEALPRGGEPIEPWAGPSHGRCSHRRLAEPRRDAFVIDHAEH